MSVNTADAVSTLEVTILRLGFLFFNFLDYMPFRTLILGCRKNSSVMKLAEHYVKSVSYFVHINLC